MNATGTDSSGNEANDTDSKGQSAPNEPAPNVIVRPTCEVPTSVIVTDSLGMNPLPMPVYGHPGQEGALKADVPSNAEHAPEFDARAALMTVITGHRLIGKDRKVKICECGQEFVGLLAQDIHEQEQQEMAIKAIYAAGLAASAAQLCWKCKEVGAERHFHENCLTEYLNAYLEGYKLLAAPAARPAELRIYQHHVLCSCLPTQPIGESGCQCRIELGARPVLSEEQVRKVCEDAFGGPWDAGFVRLVTTGLNALLRSGVAEKVNNGE